MMQYAYNIRRNDLLQSTNLLKEFGEYVLRTLGINLSELQSYHSTLKSISSIQGGRFDFEAVVAMRDMSFDGIRALMLCDVVDQVNERITPAYEAPNEEVNYVGLEHISSGTGELLDFMAVKGEVILSASPKFRRGDILYGRLRPYLNKVWVAEFDGVCSGKAIVLRPNKNRLNPYFLQCLLLSQITQQQILPLQSGTSLPRISATDLMNIRLPIPEDLKKQKQIIEEIIHRRAQAKDLRTNAETLFNFTKAKVERLILGEEKID